MQRVPSGPVCAHQQEAPSGLMHVGADEYDYVRPDAAPLALGDGDVPDGYFYWALVSEPVSVGCPDCHMFYVIVLIFSETFLKNMLVRCLGIHNKGVLDRPCTIWRVLKGNL